MEKWEYLSTFLEADASNKAIKQYIQETFDTKAKRHSPEAMIPELNKMGTDGWELVHMEPVPRVGRKDDIQFNRHEWTNTYFCVFKRLIAQPEPIPVAQAASVVEEPKAPEVKTPPVQLDPNRLPPA